MAVLVYRVGVRVHHKTGPDSDSNNVNSIKSKKGKSPMSKQNSKPIKSFSAGSIRASIWRKETEKDGQTVVRFSVRIQKQYKNDKGQWQDTDYYFPEELPKLESVTRKAFEFISVKESKESTPA